MNKLGLNYHIGSLSFPTYAKTLSRPPPPGQQGAELQFEEQDAAALFCAVHPASLGLLSDWLTVDL